MRPGAGPPAGSGSGVREDGRRDRAVYPAGDGPGLERGPQVRAVVPGGDARAGGAGQGGDGPAGLGRGGARCRDRLARAREGVGVGSLAGPVGTYSNIDPAMETPVRAGRGRRPPDVATQVVFRDGIAEWVGVLALLATACDAIALEVRHCQR